MWGVLCFFFFQVSPYTGRIHLYSCIPGKDTRPRPLFENFRQEELDLLHASVDDKEKAYKCIKDDPAYSHVLQSFVNEWNSLRPIKQKKLMGKPLQLPLSTELCYLNENINYDNEVCIVVIFPHPWPSVWLDPKLFIALPPF